MYTLNWICPNNLKVHEYSMVVHANRCKFFFSVQIHQIRKQAILAEPYKWPSSSRRLGPAPVICCSGPAGAATDGTPPKGTTHTTGKALFDTTAISFLLDKYYLIIE